MQCPESPKNSLKLTLNLILPNVGSMIISFTLYWSVAFTTNRFVGRKFL